MRTELIKHMKSAHVVLERMSLRCKECDETFESIEKYHLHSMSHAELVNGSIQNNRFVKQFKCSKCGLKFVQKSTLESHAAVHKPFPHICSCGIGYYLELDLFKHKSKVHFKNEGTFPCSFCEKVFRKCDNMQKHERIHTGEKPYQCELCDKRFNDSSQLRSHLNIIHSDKRPFPCSFCNMAFKTRYTMQNHERTHTREKPYHCKLCDIWFTRLDHLKNHLNATHSGKGPFPCSFFDEAFKCRRSMQIHKRTHTGEKPYDCEFCDKDFTERASLKTHLDTIHSDKRPFPCAFCDKAFKLCSSGEKPHHCECHNRFVKRFKCYKCGMKFVEKSTLESHATVHKPFPHMCSCGISYYLKSDLLKHKNLVHSHKNERTFSCSFCEKVFHDSNNLQIHERIHSEKRYHCELCDKRFTQLAHLKIHLNTTHSDKTPFPCSVCDKAFKTRSGKQSHERSHTGERPYRCELCDKSYKHTSHLKRHLYAIHLGGFSCELCGKNFTGQASLKKHMDTHSKKSFR